MNDYYYGEELAADRGGEVELTADDLSVHQECGAVALLSHPTEAWAAWRVKTKLQKLPLMEEETDEDVIFCRDMLQKVSRSFSTVIRLLPSEMRLPVCVFYLVLRALDTVEDDMVAFRGRERGKKEMLEKFHENLNIDVGRLCRTGKFILGVGDGDERILLEQYERVLRVFQVYIQPEYQRVISQITKEMGLGMSEFSGRELRQGTRSCEEYDLYCHYVAGLVGQGLTHLFAGSGLENRLVLNAHSLEIANSMGLFLQKVNIIRDFAEDIIEGRSFWPRDIWGKYVPSLAMLLSRDPDQRHVSLGCLNDMVTNGLELVPDCLEYLEMISNEGNFRFCAIPQVMAISTLSLCYNNPLVFSGAVKIRKGLSASIMCLTTMDEVHWWFSHFARELRRKIDASDPNAARTQTLVDQILTRAVPRGPAKQSIPFARLILFLLALTVTVLSLVRHPHNQ